MVLYDGVDVEAGAQYLFYFLYGAQLVPLLKVIRGQILDLFE